MVFFCSRIPAELVDNPEISKYLNTLFLLSPHLCFIIGLICDLPVARMDSWMCLKTSTWTEQIYVFIP